MSFCLKKLREIKKSRPPVFLSKTQISTAKLAIFFQTTNNYATNNTKNPSH